MTNKGFGVGLFQPKNPINVGGVLRACACYGANMLATTGQRYHKNGADTGRAHRELPLLQVEDLYSVIPYSWVPVAVDLVDDAESLVDFQHPRNAFYVFGPEDGTLGRAVLDWCPLKIMVPTRDCMNLASCVNVVLYDRLAKQLRG